jgi:NitT/TauT family transport system substrate-binding protein
MRKEKAMSKQTSSTIRITRRTLMVGAAGSATVLAMPAIAQSRRKIGISYGIATLDSSADAVYASIPMEFGFYAEEGLEVEIMPVAGAAAATNLLAAGQAGAMVTGATGLFGAVSNGVPAISFMCPIPDNYTSFATLKDGPIQKFEDLKGKVVGISSPALALTVKSAWSQQGWDPDKDFTTLVVGTSLPALDALQQGRVDALLLWDSIFALFEAKGAKLNYFVPEPLPQIGFSQTNSVMARTLEKEPELVAKLARAMSKSIVILASADPVQLTKLHFKTFPASRPTGLTEEQLLDLDGRRLAARKKYMRLQQRVFDRTEMIGDVSDSMVEFSARLLYDGGAIKKALPASSYFTRQFVPEMNSIDIPKLIERGRTFRV